MADFSELWRDLTINDPDAKAIIGTSAYPVFISQIMAPQYPDGPKYPALSLHDRDETPSVDALGIYYGNYQIDSWAYSNADTKALQDIMERLFHLEQPKGSGIQVTFSMMLRGPTAAPTEDKRLFRRVSFWTINWYRL